MKTSSKKIVLIFLSISLYFSPLRAQTSDPDSLKSGSLNQADQYETKARQFAAAGQYDSSTVCYMHAVTIYEQTKQVEKLVSCYRQIGLNHKQAGDSDLALFYSDLALSTGRNLLGQSHPGNAASFKQIAKIQQDQGHYRQAIENYIAAIEILEKNHGNRYSTVADTYYDLGWAYDLAGEYNQSISAYQQALAIQSEIYDSNSPKIGATCEQLGFIYNAKNMIDQSTEYFNRALAIYIDNWGENDLDVADTYESIAFNYGFFKGDYDSALAILKKVEVIRRSLLDDTHPKHTQTYESLAFLYFNKGDYPQALELYRKTLALKQNARNPNQAEIAFTHSMLAGSLDQLGQYQKAIDHYEQELEIKLAINGASHPKVAAAYGRLAAVYGSMGDYDVAWELGRKALSIQLETLGQNHPDVASGYGKLADILFDKGDYDQAIRFYRQKLAIELQVYGESHAVVAITYAMLADVYTRLGDYEQAISFYQKDLAINLDAFGPSHPMVATCYGNMGRSYFQKKDYDRAVQLFNRARTIREEILDPNHLDLAEIYLMLGAVYRRQEDYGQALDFHRKSLAIKTAVYGRDAPAVGWSYNDMALVYADQDKIDLTLEFHEKSLDIFRQSYGPKHRDVAAAYMNIASLYKEQEDYDRALQFFQKASIALVATFNDTSIYVNPLPEQLQAEPRYLNLLISKAETFKNRYSKNSQDLKDLKTALAAYRLVFDLIDRMRNRYQAEESKLFLGQRTHDAYEGAVYCALELADLTGEIAYKELVFQFVEKSKSTVLLEAIADSKAKHFAGIPDSLLDKEKQIKTDLIFYEHELAEEEQMGAESDNSKIVLWQNKVFKLKQDNEILISLLEREYPQYFKLKHSQQIISIEDMQTGLLDEQTVLIEYFSGEEAIYSVVISNDDLDVVRLEKPDQFDILVRMMRQGIIDRSFWRYTKYAYQLYQILLEPIGKHIHNKSLLIIPDGILGYIPFEALLTRDPDEDEAGRQRDFSRMPYLINDHVISYSYSATLLAETLGSDRLNTDRDLLAYAPVFSQESRTGNITVKRGLFSAESDPDSTRSFLRSGGWISPLPGTKIEVDNIKGIFDRQNKSSLIQLYGQATEENLKSGQLDRYRYIHFATHGFVDENAPDLSGIILAQDSTSSEDDVLYSSEIYNLNLNADLVVLSACETGLGQVVKGEGIIGLTRGFIYAGAENLIVSLWPVGDVSTSQLMIGFYEQLLDRQTKAESLRNTKLQLIENGSRADPFYWSPFILIGR